MTVFEDVAGFIRQTPFKADQKTLPSELLIEQSGKLSVYYAPFDYVNTQAKVVICGITPGRLQANLALEEANKKLNSSAGLNDAKRAAKETASFAGPMRENLIRMLDNIGLAQKLNINNAGELFGVRRELVHYTSALRYPVFVNGNNYSGTPNMLRTPLLKQQIDTYLTEEARQLSSDTLFIPLGSKVEEALRYLVTNGVLNERQLLTGMPHPSGANGERIAYFLGEKPRHLLSVKTNPDIIDAGKDRILNTIAAL